MYEQDAVYRTDRWSRYLWRQHLEQSEEARSVTDCGQQRVFDFPAFAREVFHRLYAYEAERMTSVKPDHAWAEKAHAELGQLGAFERVQRQCRGDKTLAGAAAVAFARTVLDNLPAPEQPLLDPEQVREQVRGLLAFAKHADVHTAVDECKRRGQQAVTAATRYAEALDDALLRRVLREACAAAGHTAQQVDEQWSAFAQWGGNELGTALKSELASTIRRSAKLQELAQQAGRMKRMAAAKQRSKADHARDEVADVEFGSELDRVLPSELIKLGHPLLRLDFARRMLERGLLQYRLTGKEVQGRGPIVVCIDQSSSMRGTKEIWAKAFALALLDVAIRQKRHCRVVHFNSDVVRVDDWAKVDVARLLDSMEYFPGGGTCFEAPLRSALEVIECDADLKKADVVLVTDGEAEVSADFAASWASAKTRLQFTTYAVHVDAPGGVCLASLAAVADHVIGLADLHEDETAVELLGM